MNTWKRLRARAANEERGAGLVEYALLVALIAVVCIGAVTFIGTSGSDKFNGAGNAIKGGPGEPVDCSQRIWFGSGQHQYQLIYADGSTGPMVDGDCPPGL